MIPTIISVKNMKYREKLSICHSNHSLGSFADCWKTSCTNFDTDLRFCNFLSFLPWPFATTLLLLQFSEPSCLAFSYSLLSQWFQSLISWWITSTNSTADLSQVTSLHFKLFSGFNFKDLRIFSWDRQPESTLSGICSKIREEISLSASKAIK